MTKGVLRVKRKENRPSRAALPATGSLLQFGLSSTSSELLGNGVRAGVERNTLPARRSGGDHQGGRRHPRRAVADLCLLRAGGANCVAGGERAQNHRDEYRRYLPVHL